MITGREKDLDLATSLIGSGMSLDIVGTRGSGRTAFLATLQARLEASGWQVLTIRGIASLKQQHFAALHLAGIAGSKVPDRVPASLAETAARLRTRLEGAKAAIFVDDWDNLDEASWGIVESVRAELRVPVALSRLQGFRPRQSPSAVPSATLHPTFVVEMKPLHLDEMEATLLDRLDAPLETGTLNRVYSKSAGNAGLAFALVDAALLEGRLSPSGDGRLASKGDLWSPGLRAVVETHLEDLDEESREALEVIAIVGAADIGTVRKLVEWDSLELLEERSLIAFLPDDRSSRVTVVPPILAEYFRHQNIIARRTRLVELIVERIGSAESASAVLAERSAAQTIGHEAVFAGLVRERARARRLVTSVEWEEHPSPSSATRYIAALIESHSAMVEETVELVLAATDPSLGDPESIAKFLALQANWVAHVHGDIEAAVGLLRGRSEDLGPYARILDAAEVSVRTYLDRVPEDFPAKLELVDGLPVSVQLALLETQMLVLVTGCRFSDARNVFQMIETLDPQASRTQPRVLLGLALLGQGLHSEALRVLMNGFEESRGRLDTEGVRGFGAAAAICHTHSGDYSAMDELLDAVFVVGEPTPFPPGAQIALLTVAANMASRRGQTLLAERYAGDAQRYNLADGPLPGQSLAWPVSQLLILNGRPAEAADELWSSGEQLWHRKAYFASILSMLVALEIKPDAERLLVAQRHLESIPEAAAMQAQGKYVAALHDHDPRGMMNAAAELAQTGRFGLAVGACQLAAQWYGESGEHERRLQALEYVSRIRSDAGEVDLDVLRFNSYRTVLSERELEVAELAAAGLTNKEIATQLVISVRTVDSHMHRIMRKLDVPNRRSLSHHLGQGRSRP